MSSHANSAATIRAQQLRERLKLRHLLFVQLGAAFAPIRGQILSELGGTHFAVQDFLAAPPNSLTIESPLVLSNLEILAFRGESAGATMGQLRARVDVQLEAGIAVCLISSQPRVAYHDVPGSSLIEDAAVFYVPLLSRSECLDSISSLPELVIPALGLSEVPNIAKLLATILSELGMNVLASLDYALFEVGQGVDFLDLLDARELEAMRGGGLAVLVQQSPKFSLPSNFAKFRYAVADCLAEEVSPQLELGKTSEGLWVIERRIRLRLRTSAETKWAARWRRSVLPADLNEKVLERARKDTNVTATHVSDLRDPIEWLTLGELLQVVRSGNFKGLDIDDITWRKFEQDLLPIRNRLAHMRLLRKGDPATVGMWLNRARNW